MSDAESGQAESTQRLKGRCVLIVEDEYFLANDLQRGFEQVGINILGPVPSLAQALALAQEKSVDGAVLDIQLDGDKVYDVADALIERDVPILFVTGYDRSDIPSRYTDVAICQKPVGADEVIAALARIVVK